MKQVAIKNYALHFIFALLLIFISSYLAQLVGTGTNSTLAAETARGLFLLFSFSVLFHSFCLRANKKLAVLKNQFENLFEENPNPMWVYEMETLRILAVNRAATLFYGYSREEFLSLSLLQLRPQRETDRLLDNLSDIPPVYSNSGSWLHKRKNGEEFFVRIFSHQTRFNNKKARMVLALDINEQLQAEQRILEQNKKLKDIAHLQSHNVRRPVASIMGLVNLFDKSNPSNEFNSLVIEKLDEVCQELDRTIHQIVEKTYELEVEQES